MHSNCEQRWSSWRPFSEHDQKALNSDTLFSLSQPEPEHRLMCCAHLHCSAATLHCATAYTAATLGLCAHSHTANVPCTVPLLALQPHCQCSDLTPPAAWMHPPTSANSGNCSNNQTLERFPLLQGEPEHVRLLCALPMSRSVSASQLGTLTRTAVVEAVATAALRSHGRVSSLDRMPSSLEDAASADGRAGVEQVMV